MLALCVVVAILCGCHSADAVNEKAFVGKWKSSRLATPLFMYANGEWEIKTEEGGILQYGVWQYEKDRIVWTIKLNDRITKDPNPVTSVKQNEFKVQESDGAITTFSRMAEPS
jgi:hypothetical protein